MDGPIPMSIGLSGLFKKKQRIPSWKGVGINGVDLGGIRGKGGGSEYDQNACMEFSKN